MSLEFKSRDVHINAIRVPWDTLPGAGKIAECYGFYKQYGFLDRVIVIDGRYWLRDGLAGLMVARAVGLKRVKVLQVTEKKDKPEPKPKPEAKPETKPESQPESQAEVKTESQAEVKTEPEPESKEDWRSANLTLCSCYFAGECWGTKEKDACSCVGYKELCSIYPDVRERAIRALVLREGGSHETEV